MANISSTIYTLTAPNSSYFGSPSGTTWILTHDTMPDTFQAINKVDTIAHLITIANTTGTDYSSDTAIITGVNNDGNVITEVVSLPGASATVSSKNYYTKITSIVPSVNTGVMNIGFSMFASPSHLINMLRSRRDIILGIEVISGTITWSIQDTLDNIMDVSLLNTSFAPVWTNSDDTALTSQTGSSKGAYTSAPTGIRLISNAYSGSVVIKFNINQSTYA